MSRFVTLTLLVVRELWISFRLLAILVLAVGSALPVVLLPHTTTPDLSGAPPDPLGWLALATAGALALIASIAGMAIAGERRRGNAGWLAMRAVPRHTILLAWFAGLALILAIGLVPASVLSWLAIGNEVVPGGAMAFAITLLAVYLAGLAALSVGLLLGTGLPAWAAGGLTLAVVGTGLLLAAIGPAGWAPLPSAGIGILSQLDDTARPIADSLRASGTALALTAALLATAAALLERADL